MSSMPTGTWAPTISLTVVARRLARGTPRVRIPTKANSSVPRLRSTISWAIRARVRDMRVPSITRGMGRPPARSGGQRPAADGRTGMAGGQGIRERAHAPLVGLSGPHLKSCPGVYPARGRWSTRACRVGRGHRVSRAHSIGPRHIVAPRQARLGRAPGPQGDVNSPMFPVGGRLLAFARELQRAATFVEVLDIARAEVRDAIGFEHAWLCVAEEDNASEVRLI